MRHQRTRPRRKAAPPAAGVTAGALAAAGLGAIAVGVVAIGQKMIRKLEETRASRPRIDKRTRRRLQLREFARDDVPPPPIR